MELHDALIFDFQAIIRLPVHYTVFKVVALNHGVLSVGEDLLRDHILVEFLRLDHLLMPLQVILAKGQITPFDEGVLKVLRRALLVRGDSTSF